MTAPAGARRWATSPALPYGARAVLWDIASRGDGYQATASQLADRAARERPGCAETSAELAAWLAALAAAGALSCHRGRYQLAPDRAAAMAAAKISGEHVAQCRPPLTRPEIRQHQELTAELVGAGRDPADVETALARWRDRRARGGRPGLAIVQAILGDLEQEWDRLAVRDPADAAVMCGTCGGCHRDTDACPPDGKRGRRW